MKEKYFTPKTEIIFFENEDIITESDETQMINPEDDNIGTKG